MITVKDAFDTFKQTLIPIYPAQEVDALTSLVLTDITGASRAKLKAFTDTSITPDQQHRLADVLSQLAAGKPVQYILGHTEFYGHNFLVTPAVLIPRPETEELVDWVANSVTKDTTLNILDIGTGSGCIAISLKLINAKNQLFALDISSGALQVAQKNAELNKADITFIEVDILAALPTSITARKYDVIVSNPPYVTGADKKQMHHNVTDFEPHTALFVPDDDPLLFYKAIADVALDTLVDGGYLFFEINETYGQEMVMMLTQKGFTDIVVKQDMSGRDRMIRCTHRG